MGETASLLASVFVETLSYWWVIIPTIFLGLIVGGIPGFSAANTIIILMPLTLAMDLQTGLVFMVSLYCAARMGAGIPAILVNIPGKKIFPGFSVKPILSKRTLWKRSRMLRRLRSQASISAIRFNRLLGPRGALPAPRRVK